MEAASQGPGAAFGVGDYARALSEGLLDARVAPPKMVQGPPGKAADKRYAVYRNNVTVSLINALVAIFPATMRITGADFFRQMARSHIRSTPPTSPLLFEYGRDFPAFVERYEPAASLPWLADVARVERAWLDAYHAADAPALAPSALAAVPPALLADLVFIAHPSTRIVRSQFPAVTIFAANRVDAPGERIAAAGPEDGLVSRPHMDVVVRRLPQGAAVFLSSLIEGMTLGSAVAAALAAEAEFDLAANLAGMIEAGAFTRIGARNDA
jgi:hypothetical protein